MRMLARQNFSKICVTFVNNIFISISHPCIAYSTVYLYVVMVNHTIATILFERLVRRADGADLLSLLVKFMGSTVPTTALLAVSPE